MASSVRTDTPRLVTISANPSSPDIPLNGGVQIDHEVVVTSQREPSARPFTSPVAIQSKSHERAQSHDLLSTRSPIARAKSDSRISAMSMNRYSSPNLDIYNSAFPDPGRESMKALAEFLMTKDPPSTNWVSVSSDDEVSLRTIKKYKFLGLEHKKRRKVPKSQKYMRLPDVAVAAMTRSGARHIAISIPWEHDYPELLQPSPPMARPHTMPRVYTSDRGTVTVLKPVAEARESVSSSSALASGAALAVGRPRANTPPSDILGPEATRTLEVYYKQQHQQQDIKVGVQRTGSRGKQTHIASALDTSKQDPRFSAGTIYSTTTTSTAPGHSRGESSISTAPSVTHIAGLRLENLPPRTSSKTKGPVAIEEELQIEAARLALREKSAADSQIYPLKSLSGSFNSGTSSSHSHPTVLGIATADLARGYRSPGPQYLSRSSTPQTLNAPTKKLPDLPIAAQFRRPASAPLTRENSGTGANTRRANSVRHINSDGTESVPQSRQDKVKARKMRDLAAIRASAAGGYFPPQPQKSTDIADLVPLPLARSATKSPRPHRRRTLSHEITMKKNLNTVTPIMIVANLPPFTGIVLPSDLPSPPMHNIQQQHSKSSSNTSINTAMRVVHTPPRSIHEECGQSDSDTIPTRPHSMTRTHVPMREKVNSGAVNLQRSHSPANSALETRRQERRSKRNMTLHERDLDQRVERLERDNTLLLSTLRAIAGSFGMLNQLLPEGTEVLIAGEKGIGRDSSAVESLVKDFERRAKRTSAGYESVSRRGKEGMGRVRLEDSEDGELSGPW